MSDLLAALDGLPAPVRFLLVLVVGIVPFLESYVAGALGVLAGFAWPIALATAVAGTVIALLVAVPAGAAIARRRDQKERTARQQKVLARVDRWGIPIASLIAPSLLAISLTAFIMVAAGLNRTKVLIWNVVAAIAWGALFTGIAAFVFAPAIGA